MANIYFFFKTPFCFEVNIFMPKLWIKYRDEIYRSGLMENGREPKIITSAILYFWTKEASSFAK